MRHRRELQRRIEEQHYARVEAVILDLQLSISSVKRANGCLDLETVRRIRARAAQTLESVDLKLAQACTEGSQGKRVADRRRDLTLLLQEPAPIERLARSLHVG